MKAINTYINEKLVIGDNLDKGYNYYPKTKVELKKLIETLIKERGNNADLNDIDTSEITDMSYLFNYKELVDFDGDISKWDISNVDDMTCMFSVSKYSGKNGDISNWDVSNVKNFNFMFVYAKYFNCNLNNWKVNKYACMKRMFDNCPLQNNPPKWYKE